MNNMKNLNRTVTVLPTAEERAEAHERLTRIARMGKKRFTHEETMLVLMLAKMCGGTCRKEVCGGEDR